MQETLTLGYSPCPNDTFIFHALTTGLVPWPGGLDVTLADVEELNGLAAQGALDVVKVSTAAAASILDDYVLLRAGGAMGYGAGPVLVAGRSRPFASLDGCKVAIPGERTTANLIFGLCCREVNISVTRLPMVFDEVMPAVEAGLADAGVVIHEGRFTFAGRGLYRVLDLGAWWEAHTGLPIPLGAIAIKRSLGEETARRMNEAIRQSLLYARRKPEAGRDYIRGHAQELSPSVIRTHIETFVTDYSLDVGEAGIQAVSRLLTEAGCGREDIFIRI
ncbi:1,4-dihydroxy-6-naphthoate synthase [Pseudodesulfovibrio thermohalotolerans]|uniref:1,4-dihydroxy-6-naphthoate synthase n=1 Tax=Pseudodesulfovibrio thermohalotolerans TaxID=2880651 RepID=UPI002442344D|nr:1,4-dihydroxy-6-naphthoate synthase [Pseudodesulfovibrio thermohalotolerans]WFS63705.1 1,4-dihydroxy-6-naphthoate synthase [Pseudodesulfovibrio thermohalotolerans]